MLKGLLRELRDGKQYVGDFLGNDLDEFFWEFAADNLHLRSVVTSYDVYFKDPTKTGPEYAPFVERRSRKRSRNRTTLQ